MAVEWDRARLKARELISRYHIEEPPINIFDIAENEGIKIIFFRPSEQTDNVSGILDKEGKKIYINATESSKRQAYTLAHELGHYFLNHQPNEYGVYRRDFTHIEKSPKEKEADIFAAELLMPRQILINTKKKFHLSDDDVSILSGIFAVSEPAMSFRLKNLKSKYDGKEDNAQ